MLIWTTRSHVRRVAKPTYDYTKSFIGFGSLLAGITGLGVGLITYTENIAAISLTRVASRFVMFTCGIILISLGLFTKFAAAAATIPDPIIGGLLGMSMCLIFGVAITNLQVLFNKWWTVQKFYEKRGADMGYCGCVEDVLCHFLFGAVFKGEGRSCMGVFPPPKIGEWDPMQDLLGRSCMGSPLPIFGLFV